VRPPDETHAYSLEDVIQMLKVLPSNPEASQSPLYAVCTTSPPRHVAPPVMTVTDVTLHMV